MISAVGVFAGWALVLTGVGFGLGAGVEAATSGPLAAPLATGATVVGGVGLGLLRWCRLPAVLRPAQALAAVLVAWTTAVVCTAALYQASGRLGSPARALFESSAGYATLAASTLSDPGVLPGGLLAVRAWSQWVAGLAALVVMVLVLPALGSGVTGQVAAGLPQPEHLGSRRTAQIVRRFARWYVTLTVLLVAAYAAVGTPPIDALTLGATTISTGGFTNHPDLESFRDPARQWVAILGMVMTGGGLTLIVSMSRLRRTGRAALRSAELRTYGLVLVGGTAALVTLASDELPAAPLDGLRESLFTTASLVSTTGYVVADWSAWSELAQVVVVALLAVGAMSGSTGSGFRILQARILAAYARGVLRAELHPRAVTPVSVGDAFVTDDRVVRTVGFQVLYLTAAFVGAVLLAATGVDLLGSVSGALSALSTVGPALGDLAPGRQEASLHGADLLVLGGLAVVGRIGIYPIFTAGPSLLGVWRRRRSVARRVRRPGRVPS